MKAGQARDARCHNALLDGLDQRIDACRRAIAGSDLIEVAVGDRDMPAPNAQRPHDCPAHAVEHHLRADDPVRKGYRNAFSLGFVRKALLAEAVAQ